MFLGRLGKTYAVSPLEAPADPTEELVWSALLEDSSEGTARVALSRVNNHFVDFNEVRVSRPEEVAEVLPNTISEPKARSSRLVRALQALFNRFDSLSIAELRDQPKREARAFIASIGEMSPFVEGRVCLFALGIHAIPVDRTLVSLLVRHRVVHPDTDCRDTQGFLERIVPARDAVQVAMLLEAFRQSPEKIPAPPERAARSPARRRARAARKPARKKK